MPDTTSPSTPSPAQAILCFGVVIAIIVIGLFLFAIDLHSLMFLCLIWATVNARLLGHSSAGIRQLMSSAISRALPAIYIFILIGMVIASFMHSGTIATLMYFGLDWLSPGSFLAVGMLLCALMSMATGTAWGTAGTLGVVFIGIGGTMGIPLPIVAGMVVCGATFGDKMSPISDTTNLAAMSAETDLYRHIYSMLFTTAPSFLLALIIFTLIGLGYADGDFGGEEIGTIRQALSDTYLLYPLISLIPIFLLAILSIRRVPAEITMSLSVLAGVIIAVAYQGQSPVAVLNALWENTPGSTGIDSLNDLLGRGGISSMSWTLMLALMALGLSWYSFGNILTLRTLEWFISISMCFLAVQKLQVVESFSTMFLNYNLLARRWVLYGKIYPFGEAFAGVLMVTGALTWLSAPVAMFIGTVGAVSVFKAVYIDKRELKCACVGGDSNVPLGFVSLTENLMTMVMGIWMPIRVYLIG